MPNYSTARYSPEKGYTRFYAGRWRTEAGIEAHRAGRRRRHRDPIDRIKSDLASNHAKRERMIDGSRTP